MNDDLAATALHVAKELPPESVPSGALGFMLLALGVEADDLTDGEAA